MIQSITNIYQTRPKEFNRFVKFAIVGALGAIIDFDARRFWLGITLGQYFIRLCCHAQQLYLEPLLDFPRIPQPQKTNPIASIYRG